MKTAIISITENGRKLSRRISDSAFFLNTERYCFCSHTDEVSRSFEDLKDLVSGIFNKYEAIVFVCACGIAVRSVAPCIRSKISDPAVIVIDDCGKFVIPVLSGHIGRANAVAENLAELIGAQAVITTATDTGSHFSPDSFAVANDLMITDMNAAKAIASAVLDSEKVGIVSDYEYINLPKDFLESTDCRSGIYIGNRDLKPFSVTLNLTAKNVVLGIGCKRGTECDKIENAVLAALETAGIDFERICAIATIDLKADEKGLLGFCEKHDLRISAYTAQELMDVEGDFSSSDFVKSVTGVDNVCERSAVKCSGGRLILRKTAADGVTVAAAEKPLILDFERKVL